MNRRDFVGRVVLGGAAAACTNFSSAHAAPASAPHGFKLRFVGLMAFIERKDRSFLVATPGQSHHHTTHVPFLMARKDSTVAKRLDMVAVPGVIPYAFDNSLGDSNPTEFVYRSLQNTSIDVISGTTDRVNNEATQMAHLATIAPGKRLRGNLEKWAPATISLRGGALENSAAHPDAGKMWSFGSHQQRLTDAVNYYNAPGASTTLRLTSGADVQSVTLDAAESAELWMISSAAMDARMNNPTALVHSELLFEFLVDAKTVLAECPDATGRDNVPATRIPFAQPTTASAGLIATEAPPFTDICYICDILLGDVVIKR
jgi:hypothetical protein